jgi:hypothetical protein
VILNTKSSTNNISLTPNVVYDAQLLELSRSLSQATYALQKLQDTKSVQFLIDSLQKTNQMQIELLLYDLLNLNYTETGS